MSEVVEVIKGLALFEGLSEEELGAVAEMADPRHVDAGETIFLEGDPGDTVCVVQSGVVKISTLISEGVEKTLVMIREGGVFGELVLLDEAPRSASAIAEEDANLVMFGREKLLEFIESHPAAGLKIVSRLCRTVIDRLRTTTELLRQNLRWSLEVSGSLSLNFHHLLTDSVELGVDLVGGKRVIGALLKVEQSAAGYEVWLRCADDRLVVIPYHAILSISFGADVLRENQSELDEQSL